MKVRVNRRQWLATTSSALALSAVSYRRVLGANEQLNIASVGTGGKGWSDLTSVAASPYVQVVALCNVDSSREHFGMATEKYPEARQYADWRRLLDESKDIDAVIVSTPDFMHAPVALPFMHLGKHVFCEKPLTHTVFEARQMRLAAEKYKCVTQMGNQIQSHSAYRTAVRWVHEGRIGKVSAVYSWQASGTSWPRSPQRPTSSDPVPSHVNWDLWTGVAPERPYKASAYHPFNWRGWVDFGTGMLGDFGCHILDPVSMALELTAPISVQAIAPSGNPEVWVDRCKVSYQFPGTQFTNGESLSLMWYDGVDVLPERELLQHLPEDFMLPKAGSWLVGEVGSMLVPHVAAPALFPQDRFPASELTSMESLNHYVQWADACRGVGQTTSDFAYASGLTETVLLGTVAQRVPGERLKWDSQRLAFAGSEAAQAMVNKPYRSGWEPAWL